MPVRIQLSRRRDWRMPPNAVKVDRSTPYGNPFRARRVSTLEDESYPWLVERDSNGSCITSFATEDEARAHVVTLFQAWIDEPDQAAFRALAGAELAGKDIACWCGLDKPCHGDIWLAVANEAANGEP